MKSTDVGRMKAVPALQWLTNDFFCYSPEVASILFQLKGSQLIP